MRERGRHVRRRSAFGAATCAVIIPSRPTAIAALKGLELLAAASPRPPCSTGSALCESASTEPWPGKCLATVTMSASCWPSTKSAPSSETSPTLVAEAAQADHRVVRVDVHVEHRRQVHVEAEPLQVGALGVPGLVGQLGAAGGAQRHVARQHHHRLLDAHHVAALLVDRDEGRHPALQQPAAPGRSAAPPARATRCCGLNRHTPPTCRPFTSSVAFSSTVRPAKPTIISWPTFCSGVIAASSADTSGPAAGAAAGAGGSGAAAGAAGAGSASTETGGGWGAASTGALTLSASTIEMRGAGWAQLSSNSVGQARLTCPQGYPGWVETRVLAPLLAWLRRLLALC